MLEYAEVQSDFLVGSGISGFVFKSDSASCGLERVKVYRGDSHKPFVMVLVCSQRFSPRYTPTFQSLRNLNSETNHRPTTFLQG